MLRNAAFCPCFVEVGPKQPCELLSKSLHRGEEEEPEKTTGTSGRRKREGVVYTLDYIGRFIVAETLGTHLRESFEDTFHAHAKKGADITDYENIPWRKKSAELEVWQAYRDRLKSLRIVDPAFGLL